MISYRDKAFCSFHSDCLKSSDCGRVLSEDMKAHAKELGLPIAYFMSPPMCHVVENKENVTE